MVSFNYGAGAGGALSGAATGATIGSLVPGIGTAIGAGVGGLIGGVGGLLGGGGGDDNAEKRRKNWLYHQAAEAGGEGDETYQSYRDLGARGNGALDALQAQAQGQNSISAEQLRQALGQNLAAQRSMAASAAPQNAAMAARTAAIQSARLGSGLAGQQALAGLQERNQAQAAYGNLLQGLRGQDLNAALGSRQNALAGYGAANAGPPQKSWIEQYGPAIQGGLSAFAATQGRGSAPQAGASSEPNSYGLMNPYAASDRRLKTGIRDGEDDASKAIEGVRAYVYKYKDKQYGKGKRIGIMADELERAGLGHAVVNTPAGKMVHGAQLATANTAIAAALARRVAKLEGARK